MEKDQVGRSFMRFIYYQPLPKVVVSNNSGQMAYNFQYFVEEGQVGYGFVYILFMINRGSK